MPVYPLQKYPLQTETGIIIGIAQEVHRILGKGFLEIVYKDALQYELCTKGILFEREKEYPVAYKTTICRIAFMLILWCLDKSLLK